MTIQYRIIPIIGLINRLIYLLLSDQSEKLWITASVLQSMIPDIRHLVTKNDLCISDRILSYWIPFLKTLWKILTGTLQKNLLGDFISFRYRFKVCTIFNCYQQTVFKWTEILIEILFSNNNLTGSNFLLRSCLRVKKKLKTIT